VLGFNDYARVFGSDTSKGELTDQVRQFFLNGGQQAIIMRVASGASESTATLGNLDAAPTLTIQLKAENAGDDGRKLRAEVDYDTSSPERTFNLTLFQESVDISGNVTVTGTETFSNLTLVSTDPRFVKRIVEGNSSLVGLVTVTDPLPAGDPKPYSVSAKLTAAGTLGDAVHAAVLTATNSGASGPSGKFKLRVGKRQAVEVALTFLASPATISESDFQTAIDLAVAPLGLAAGDVDVTYVGGAAGDFIKVTANTAAVAGEDIQLDRAGANDIAVALGFGKRKAASRSDPMLHNDRSAAASSAY